MYWPPDGMFNHNCAFLVADWPDWKNGRNLYTDVSMVNRSVEFASKVAKTAAPFKRSLLAMEFGNEMNCCTDTAPPDSIINWTHAIYNAFKRNAGSSVLVVPGTDENTIIGDTSWPLGTISTAISCWMIRSAFSR